MKRMVEVIVLAGIALGMPGIGDPGRAADSEARAVALPTAQVVAQDSYSGLSRRFQYGPETPAIGIQEKGVQERAGVKIHDITYASPKGGRVPAYLVVPEGKGHFAGILWAHWMMPNSPTESKRISE